MNILAIDTSGPVAGCAVMIDGRVVHSIALSHGLTHSETIMPAVEEAMEGSGIRCAEIDVFAAVAGPGSFTGVRIGVCAAKGFAHAVNKPCVPVHALEALAMNFFGFDGLVCPILDARRGQVYCALFDTKNGFPERVAEDDAVALDVLLDRLPQGRRIVFAGDGLAVHARTIAERLGDRALIAPANLRDLRPDAVCALAERKRDEWVSAYELRPVYLRAPQAERERNARLSQEAQK
ncbi:MAG: tRNA (adenosine(37)-N6)-threonylcarbamoyltransferase complex dimerization subunit type 1 TsaB [Candidatus Faecivicinus sp.]